MFADESATQKEHTLKLTLDGLPTLDWGRVGTV